MKQKKKLFFRDHITNKDELVYSISAYIDHCQKDGIKDERWSAQKLSVVIRLFSKLLDNIQPRLFPDLDDWWYYDYHITHYEAILELCHCSEITYDKAGFTDTVSTDETFDLVKIPCELLTIDEFSEMFQVTRKTVMRWIKQGKLRGIKPFGTSWLISELSDKPGRQYEPVMYKLPKPSETLYAEFPFTKGARAFIITKNDSDIFQIALFKYLTSEVNHVDINEKTRSRFEFCLLSVPHVVPLEFSCRNVHSKKREHMEAEQRYDRLAAYMTTTDDEDGLDYGPVIVSKGSLKGHIGDYDDDEI